MSAPPVVAAGNTPTTMRGGVAAFRIGASVLTLIVTTPPSEDASTAMAASLRDQAYYVCANGYDGPAGDCRRACGRYLKQSPATDEVAIMCRRRVREKPGTVARDPD